MAEPRLKAGIVGEGGAAHGRSGRPVRRRIAQGRRGFWRRAGRAARARRTLRAVAGARGDGALAWMRGTGAAPVDQAAADAYVARQVRFDPDVWVLEFDSPDLVPPFEAKLV